MAAFRGHRILCADYYTGGYFRPPKDAQQDYALTSAKEEGGKTKLTFERKRDTGDNKDVQLKAGEGVFLIWAYHSSSEGDNPTNFPYHSKRGSSAQKHVVVPKVNSTAVPKVNSTAVPKVNSTAVPMATSIAPNASVTTAQPTWSTTKPSKANFICGGALVNVVLAVLLSFLYIYL